jgi:hypothetical protein
MAWEADMSNNTRTALFLTGAWLVAGCGAQDIVEPVAAAVATGAVRDANGVGQAAVTVRGSSCGSEDLNEWQTATRPSGEYDLLMNTFSGLDSVRCVVLVADPPPGSGLSADTVRVDSVLFSAGGGNPRDSVRVNFILQALTMPAGAASAAPSAQPGGPLNTPTLFMASAYK